MAEVDFSNYQETKKWGASVPEDTRCRISSRAALRVVGYIVQVEDGPFDEYVLAVFRPILISAVRGFECRGDVEFLSEMAREAKAHAQTAGYAISQARTAESSLACAIRASAFSADFSEQGPARTILDSVEATTPLDRSTTIEAVKIDAENANPRGSDLPVWSHLRVPDEVAANHITFLKRLDTNRSTWGFWHDWYQAMWRGNFIDWKFAAQVAQISDDVWKTGAAEVARAISEIKLSQRNEDAHLPIPPEQIASVRRRIDMNRDAIALSVAGLLEDLAAFRERVRCLNHIDPDFRDELLNFIDELSAKLETLLEALPTGDNSISDAKAVALMHWYRQFQPLVQSQMKAYVSPENVSEAIVPTGIILGCGAVGALVAGPAGAGVGLVAGGLISRQIKPGQAADDLIGLND